MQWKGEIGRTRKNQSLISRSLKYQVLPNQIVLTIPWVSLFPLFLPPASSYQLISTFAEIILDLLILYYNYKMAQKRFKDQHLQLPNPISPPRNPHFIYFIGISSPTIEQRISRIQNKMDQSASKEGHLSPSNPSNPSALFCPF